MGEQPTDVAAIRALVFINQAAVEMYSMWSGEQDAKVRAEYGRAVAQLHGVAATLKRRIKAGSIRSL